MKKKILLGMSGGTDSSISAILLQDQGYEVIGVTFRFFESENESHIADAATLAKELGITHFIHDEKELFKREIIDYFTNEYISGRTPVPCVKCNNTLKWPLLIKLADELGIEHVSTGHYVQIEEFEGRSYIASGTDPDKDQSFFLWGLPQNIIRRMVLPLGKMTKTNVRKIAAERGFDKVSKKKDSLGICFCADDYRSFLKKHIDNFNNFEGNFIDSDGVILGKHNGYPFFTVGQRRNLGIHLNKAIYVKEIKPETNHVVLSGINELYKNTITLKDVIFICPDDFSEEVTCKIRYRKQSVMCRVSLHPNKKATVELLQPEHSISPGQSAVFYIENRVIGGGIIVD